jgi:phospho-N-acetylmuramoyl-pentapeptide-transferase
MQKILPYLVAAVAGFLVTAVVGRILVPLLRQWKAGQSIKTDGPTWHMSKQGTPTMGGIMFIVGILVTVLIFTWQNMRQGDYSALFVLLFALVFGAIGFVDDWAKLRKKENTGLTAPQKFLLQLAAAIAFTALLRYTGHLTPNLYIPFWNTHIVLPWVVYMIFAAFVMVGCVNAVNITDGIDGLAAGVTVPVALFYTVVCALWGKAALGTFSGALLGALCGFLIYNFHPAKVFMGDTGSLFLGGAVCGLAFALDMPLILILVGIIYLVETASDILQVAYFKLTHGKRIFRMAPLHHHLELGGWSEYKLVFVFAGITLLFCALAYLGVAGRY